MLHLIDIILRHLDILYPTPLKRVWLMLVALVLLLKFIAILRVPMWLFKLYLVVSITVLFKPGIIAELLLAAALGLAVLEIVFFLAFRRQARLGKALRSTSRHDHRLDGVGVDAFPPTVAVSWISGFLVLHQNVLDCGCARMHCWFSHPSLRHAPQHSPIHSGTRIDQNSVSRSNDHCGIVSRPLRRSVLRTVLPRSNRAGIGTNRLPRRVAHCSRDRISES